MSVVDQDLEQLLNKISTFHNTLLCGICLELLEDPIKTSCNHQFCRKCIMKVIDGQWIGKLSDKKPPKAKRKRSCVRDKCPVCNSSALHRRSISRDTKSADIISTFRNFLTSLVSELGEFFSLTSLPFSRHNYWNCIDLPDANKSSDDCSHSESIPRPSSLQICAIATSEQPKHVVGNRTIFSKCGRYEMNKFIVPTKFLRKGPLVEMKECFTKQMDSVEDKERQHHHFKQMLSTSTSSQTESVDFDNREVQTDILKSSNIHTQTFFFSSNNKSCQTINSICLQSESSCQTDVKSVCHVGINTVVDDALSTNHLVVNGKEDRTVISPPNRQSPTKERNEEEECPSLFFSSNSFVHASQIGPTQKDATTNEVAPKGPEESPTSPENCSIGSKTVNNIFKDHDVIDADNSTEQLQKKAPTTTTELDMTVSTQAVERKLRELKQYVERQDNANLARDISSTPDDDLSVGGGGEDTDMLENTPQKKRRKSCNRRVSSNAFNKSKNEPVTVTNEKENIGCDSILKLNHHQTDELYTISTGLNVEQRNIFVAFSKKFNLECLPSFENVSETAHNRIVLVVGAYNRESRGAERTLKYLQGVSIGCSIVGFDWVKTCLNTNTLLPPIPEFELVDITGMDGPRLSRECRLFSPRSTCTRRLLLDGWDIWLHGELDLMTGINKDNLRGIVSQCGGRSVSGINPTNVKLKPYVIVVHSTQFHSHPDRDVRFNKLQQLATKYKIGVVDTDWLIESVGCYSLMPFHPFILKKAEGRDKGSPVVSLAVLNLNENYCDQVLRVEEDENAVIDID